MSYIDTPDKQAERLRQIKIALLEQGITPVDEYKTQAIDYLDIAPKPFEVQIPLVEYFERIKRHKADRWQHDFCQRLQDACVNRHVEPTRAIIHAEAQLGKSTILAQSFPAWILGHDPLHRVALSTYNVTRSQSHSKAVIAIMNLPIHKDIFRDPEGWVKPTSSKEKWMTNARLAETTDAQDSFNPVGLQSGLTGSGFDTLIIDDPYASERDAFSETLRKSLQSFIDADVESRIGSYSNVFGMFHRYHVQDLAGYLLDNYEFDYWRYAAICDGPYVHDATGEQYLDPLNREIGEYISERRSADYYVSKKKNKRTWLSMFQGRPSSESGDFFQTDQIATLTGAETEVRRAECSTFVRAWDHADTEEGGDYSVGAELGMSPDGRATLFDVVREQVESAGRDALQLSTAHRDGKHIPISIPKDPGAAGGIAVFHIKQLLTGFNVIEQPTSGTKEDRARPLASAVNSGLLTFGCEDHLEADKRWVRIAREELRDFPLSDHDDIVDALSDAFNECFSRVSTGLVIKNFSPSRNLWTRAAFAERFGSPKIPAHWTIYAGAKITAEATRANSAVIVARAATNAHLPDTLFIVAEYKEFTSDYSKLFEWFDAAFETYCENAKDVTIMLDPESAPFRTTITARLQRRVILFNGDSVKGLAELNWYVAPTGDPHPVYAQEQASHLYGLIDDPQQMTVAHDQYGLVSVRQEAATWGYISREKDAEPSQIGAVLSCLRMVTSAFRTTPADYNFEEKVENAVVEISPSLSREVIEAMTDEQARDGAYQRRLIEEKRIRTEMNAPVRSAAAMRFRRR